MVIEKPIPVITAEEVYPPCAPASIELATAGVSQSIATAAHVQGETASTQGIGASATTYTRSYS